MTVTASLNTYATWDNATNTYTTLEAARTYGVLEGASLQITRTLPSSGTLANRRLRTLVVGGSMTPSGVLPKQATRTLTGTLLSAGAVVRGLQRTLVGTLSSSGVLKRGLGRSLNGSLTSSGTLTTPRILRWAYAGALGSSGTILLGKIFTRALSGTLASSGVLKRGIGRALNGVLASSGTLKRGIGRSLSGSLTSSGTLALRQTLYRAYTGALASSGSVLLGKIYTRGLNGMLTSSGSATLVATVRRLLAVGGSLASSGLLQIQQAVPTAVELVIQGQLWLQGWLDVRVQRAPAPDLLPGVGQASPGFGLANGVAGVPFDPWIVLVSAPDLGVTTGVSSPPLMVMIDANDAPGFAPVVGAGWPPLEQADAEPAPPLMPYVPRS